MWPANCLTRLGEVRLTSLQQSSAFPGNKEGTAGWSPPGAIIHTAGQGIPCSFDSLAIREQVEASETVFPELRITYVENTVLWEADMPMRLCSTLLNDTFQDEHRGQFTRRKHGPETPTIRRSELKCKGKLCLLHIYT